VTRDVIAIVQRQERTGKAHAVSHSSLDLVKSADSGVLCSSLFDSFDVFCFPDMSLKEHCVKSCRP
jgi:hypothetical protein